MPPGVLGNAEDDLVGEIPRRRVVDLLDIGRRRPEPGVELLQREPARRLLGDLMT